MIPLQTLDPAAPLDDLEWLDDLVGDARVVAIGESAHYNQEFLQLRHRVLRYLAERHGFSALAAESGFVEGWRVDDWLHGKVSLEEALAHGLSALMGLWTPVRAQLEWMKASGTRFYGIDVPGSLVSLLPGLDDPRLREIAALFGEETALTGPAAIQNYLALPQEQRDALTAGLAELKAALRARKLEHPDYDRAMRVLETTTALDQMFRELPRGGLNGLMLHREPAIADTVEWILQREDRIVLAAHNAHVQRWPAALPGLPPSTTAGLHIASLLRDDYVVIGTTSETGDVLGDGFYEGRFFSELPPPEPDSLDARMSGHGLAAAVDLAEFKDVTRQRYGSYYSDVDVPAAYDALIHIPRVTAATPDEPAVAQSPAAVREAFAKYAASRR